MLLMNTVLKKNKNILLRAIVSYQNENLSEWMDPSVLVFSKLQV